MTALLADPVTHPRFQSHLRFKIEGMKLVKHLASMGVPNTVSADFASQSLHVYAMMINLRLLFTQPLMYCFAGDKEMSFYAEFQCWHESL